MGAHSITVGAPLPGWAASLDEAPDAVFAGRILGDGVAIDPTGATLTAPFDGLVLLVAPTHHAVSLRADNGAEVLLHLGVETVALGGQGFTPHVAAGQRVRAGEALISFDMDAVARRAASLLTPVIVTNGEAFRIATRQTGRLVAAGEPIMTLEPIVGAAAASPALADGGEALVDLVVTLPHGLHARPAARVAELARSLPEETALVLGDRRANARSPIAVLALGVRCGDALSVWARGDDAAGAARVLAELIATGIEEAAPAAAPPAEAPTPGASDAHRITGVRAAPGLAIGAAVRLADPEPMVNAVSAGVEAETAALEAALAQVLAGVRARAATGGATQQAILAAHAAFLEDPELGGAARAAIAGGRAAGPAWRDAVQAYVAVLSGLGDPLMAERADDLRDLERQALLAISGETLSPQTLPLNAIVLADDLMPSQLAALDASRLAGLATARGGPTSHVAILAAALGVPALVAAGPAVLHVADGALLILDADRQSLTIAPSPDEIAAAQGRLAERAAQAAAARAASAAPARTADGTRIEVFANVGALADAEAAAANGAEGCGLLRTEFLFLDRPEPPSEDEQLAAYQAIAAALAGRPLVVRTLDVGGDKPAPYIALPAEENPALGVRGVRVSLARPELLRAQVRAILRVAPFGQCRILVPMVASLEELRAVRRVVDAQAKALGIAGPVRLGVMIETPAAAMTADLLAAEADFLSIGTNDLAQYALAMDRTNPALAAQVDALHPAVLRLIAEAARGGAAHGRAVAVCGGLASDLAAVPILIGLGVTELSAAPGVVAELKARVRTLDLAACQGLARRALAQTSPEAVRLLDPQ